MKLTGSSAPVVLGLHPRESPLQLYARLTGAMEDRWARAKALGRAIEPALVDMLAAGLFTPTRPAPGDGDGTAMVAARPDAWAEFEGRRWLVVVKNVPWREATWPPPWLVATVQHELVATGARQAIVGCLEAGAVFHVQRMAADESWRDEILKASEEFLGLLERSEPPAPTEHDAAALDAVYPVDDGRLLRVGPSAAAAWEQAKRLRQQAETYLEAAKRRENKLRALAGQHAGLALPGGRRLLLRGAKRRLAEA